MSDKIEEIRERNLLKRISQKEPEIAIRELYYDLVTLAHLAERQFDKIQQLRAEIERLRAALKGIDALYPDVPDALGANDLRVIVAQMGDLARNALEGKP